MMREMRSLLFAFRFPGRRGGDGEAPPLHFRRLFFFVSSSSSSIIITFVVGKFEIEGREAFLSLSLSLHLCLPLYGPEIEREGKFRVAEAQSYQGLDGRMDVG